MEEVLAQKPRRWRASISRAWLAGCLPPGASLGSSGPRPGRTAHAQTCPRTGDEPRTGPSCARVLARATPAPLCSMLYCAGSFHLAGCPAFPSGDFRHTAARGRPGTRDVCFLSPALGFSSLPRGVPAWLFFCPRFSFFSVRLFVPSLPEPALCRVPHFATPTLGSAFPRSPHESTARVVPGAGFCALVFAPPWKRVGQGRSLFPGSVMTKMPRRLSLGLGPGGSLKTARLEMYSFDLIQVIFLVRMNLARRGHFSVNKSPGPSKGRVLRRKVCLRNTLV